MASGGTPRAREALPRAGSEDAAAATHDARAPFHARVEELDDASERDPVDARRELHRGQLPLVDPGHDRLRIDAGERGDLPWAVKRPALPQRQSVFHEFLILAEEEYATRASHLAREDRLA